MARIGSLWITLLVALMVLTGLPSIPTAGARQDMPRNEPDSLSESGDVPTFRGDPAHTGVNPGPGPNGPPAELWRFRTGAEVYAAPAVVDGTVYLGSSDGFLYALDAATGEQAWRVRTRQGIYDTPTVAGDAVYAVSGGVLAAFDRAMGDELWVTSGDWIDGAPTLVDGVLYVAGSYPEILHAFDAATGDEIWRVETTEEDGSIDAALTVVDGVVYVGSFFGTGGTGMFAAFDAATGDELHDTAAVVDDLIYATGYDVLYAFEAATGAERWRVTTPSFITGEATVSDGLVVVGTLDGTVVAVDAVSGNEQWRSAAGQTTQSPTAAGAELYTVTAEGLVALSVADGSERWRWTPEDEEEISSDPVVTGGVIYLGLGERDLVALGAPSETAATPAPDDVTPAASPAAIASGPGAPMFRGNAARTGEQPGPNPRTHELLWTFQMGGRVDASPVVVDGVVYVGSGDANLYAIDASTGTERWRFASGSGILSSPAVVDGVVYLLGGDGTLFALDAATGTETWQASVAGYSQSSSPAVIDGVVYALGDGLVALNAATGAEIWRVAEITLGPSSPAVLDGTAYVVGGVGEFGSNALYAVDAVTGDVRWHVEDEAIGAFTPAVVGDLVYAGGEGAMLAFDTSDGSERWRFELDAGLDVTSSPAVSDGALYVGVGDRLSSGPGGLVAIDAATGDLRWGAASGSNVESSPAVVDGVVYAAELFGTLYALDAETGATLWSDSSFDTTVSSSPAVVDGVVYVGGDEHLYAIGNVPGTQGLGDGSTSAPTDADPAGAAPRGPNRTGEQPGPAPDEPPAELWRAELAPAGGGFVMVEVTVTVADGVAYLAGEDGLVAVDATTGAERWRVTDAPGYAVPAVADGIVYAGGEDGVLYALDAATGDEQWQLTTGDAISSTPAVVDGAVYVGSDDGYLYAADAATGAELWRFDTVSLSADSPVVAGDVVFVADDDSTLYAVDRASGAEIWNVTIGEGVLFDPVVRGGMVYIGENDFEFNTGTVVALDAASGREAWRFEGDLLGGPIAVSDNAVYVGYGSVIAALDPASGDERWSVELGGTASGPAVVDGIVFASTGRPMTESEGEPGDLVALNATDGAELWRVQVTVESLASPVIVDGTVYVGSMLDFGGQGTVYALGAR